MIILPRRKFDPQATYQGIAGTSRITGFSQGFIRDGCKAGRIPHVMNGQEYKINVQLFLEQMEREALASVRTAGDVM